MMNMHTYLFQKHINIYMCTYIHCVHMYCITYNTRIILVKKIFKYFVVNIGKNSFFYDFGYKKKTKISN